MPRFSNAPGAAGVTFLVAALLLLATVACSNEAASADDREPPGATETPTAPETPAPTPTPEHPAAPGPDDGTHLTPEEPPQLPEGFEAGSLTNLVEPDDGSGRLFFTEQLGRILTLPRDGWQGTGVTPEVFLDIRERVHTGFWEEGLLGLAFHPQFAENGHFYVHYSRPRLSVISRFSLDPNDPTRADPDSEVVILEVEQPLPNHNGGQLRFGPDGYLYIGFGDGGGSGDELGNSQDLQTLHGAILRIDVDRTEEGRNYAIPPDNPFMDDPAARDEIWAYGFRNPWRFSFDSETGDLWVADVGQDVWESIYIVRPGLNYGWNIVEGEECFPPGSECAKTGLEMPLHTYRIHVEGDCSVTGGYVYRGLNYPDLVGSYVFGDFCSGRVWGLVHDGEEVASHHLLAETGVAITSFGVDLDGELYIVTHEGGIYGLTLEPPAPEEEAPAQPQPQDQGEALPS